MKDLSITQEYLVCALNDKGRLSSYNLNLSACFVGAGLMELQLEGCISMDQKTIKVLKELPEERAYLKPLYEEIHAEKVVKIEKVIDNYMITFTDKAMKALVHSVKDSLKESGMMMQVQVGLINKKEDYAPSKEARTAVVEKIRAELLEDGEITEDVVILTALLDKANCLKEYFSKFEQKELKNRMQEIRESSWGQEIKEMTEHIEILIACIIATGAAAH